MKNKPYFPMFIDLSDKNIVVVGGGNIATRRVKTLLSFTRNIRVIAPKVTMEMMELGKAGYVELITRPVKRTDFAMAYMVIAATNDRKLNDEIHRICRQEGVYVNVASDREQCDFYFPGIYMEEGLVVGITASGLDHKKARRIREEIQNALERVAQEDDNEEEMMTEVIIGSRESKLAVLQSEMVKSYIEQKNREENAGSEITVNILTMKTTGDIILDRTLDKVGGKGLFVKELDRALLDGKSNLSVHSLKDMPMEVPEELPLLAFSKREDPRDVLVLPEGVAELDPDKPLGCSSLRRTLQLEKLYPEMEVKSIRGNLQTRLRKLDEGEYSGLILAAAGLKRLGLESRISRYFTPDEMIPSAGQGILAVQGRKGEDYGYLDGYCDRDAWLAGAAERAYVKYLDGGCSSPVAAFAEVDGDEIFIRGLYYSEATGKWLTGQIRGAAEDGEKLGIALAKQLKSDCEGR